jgi:hypothetical protein
LLFFGPTTCTPFLAAANSTTPALILRLREPNEDRHENCKYTSSSLSISLDHLLSLSLSLKSSTVEASALSERTTGKYQQSLSLICGYQ